MNYLPPRISIVDGTYLCLLPSSDNMLNGSVGGGSSEKNQHQQTHIANDDMNHTNEGQTINIPAVPLSSICNIYHGEYISCCLGDDTTAGDIQIDREKMTSSSDTNILHELPIETIQIRTSDVSNAEYRFIHSISLNNDNDISTNNIPLRIVVSDNLDEANVSVNNKHVKVTFPSFTTSDEHKSAQYEECKVYGGEYYNIAKDDVGNGVDIMMNSMQSGSNKGQQLFEVQGAGSCLVADFLGLVGYEQALVLPQISAELLSKLNSSDDDESIQQQKELLQMILRHSFLTDGTGILLPKSCANKTMNVTTTKTDNNNSIISLTMSPLDKLGEDVITNDTESRDGGSEVPTQEDGDASAHHSSNTTIDTQPTDTSNNTEPQEDPEWLKLIAQTVEHRLSKQEEESNQIKRSAQARIDLVNQGLRTLHAANRPMNHSKEGKGGWSNDPEVFRLRYGIQPRTSSGPCGGGISVVLDLELDILMPHSAEGTANSPDPTTTNRLHDFHISCSLTSNNKENQSTTTPENIRTSSGVAPSLTSRDCITMLASVCLEDIKISMNDDDNSTLDVSIQGLWVDDASSSPNNNSPTTRRGVVLCILRLSIDSLFLGPPASTPQQRSGGQWIQHEIDFTSDNNQQYYPEPSVIVDYRQPRTLTIDTSSEMNSTNAQMWKDLVTNLNASIGGSSYIDLYCKKDSPRLKLVIFSSNPEERLAVVKLVLRSLPESAKLIVDEEDGAEEEEKQSVKALLMSLKREAETLKRHRALLSSSTIKQGGVVQEDLLTEMSTLQCNTDGIASTIKRGWM